MSAKHPSKKKAPTRERTWEKDRKDAARYRILRDDGHLYYLDPQDRNTKTPAGSGSV